MFATEIFVVYDHTGKMVDAYRDEYRAFSRAEHFDGGKWRSVFLPVEADQKEVYEVRFTDRDVVQMPRHYQTPSVYALPSQAWEVRTRYESLAQDDPDKQHHQYEVWAVPLHI